MSNKREIGCSLKGSVICLSYHVERKLKDRSCKQVQDLFRQPHNMESMIRNICNRSEKNIDLRRVNKNIKNGIDTYVIHYLLRVNDSIIEQSVILGYSRGKKDRYLTVVSYCWQIMKYESFSRDKCLYHNKSRKGLSYTAPKNNHVYIEYPKMSIDNKVIKSIIRKYNVNR